MSEDVSFYDTLWDTCADLDAISPAARHRHRLVEDRVARLVGEGGGRVLDVGCGPGRLLERLAQRLPRVELAGCDVSERALELARSHGATSELFPLDLAASDFSGAPFGRYDIAVCSEVVEHLSDDRVGVQRLGQLVIDGGHLVLTVPGGGKSRFDERVGHQRHYTRRTLSTLLVDAGLTPVEVTEWGFPFHNGYRAAIRTTSRLAFRQRPEAAHEALSPALTRAYSLASRALYPLYYLNAPFWGEQLIAVARA